MAYTGLFLRHFMGQTPGGPSSSSWTASPDIIPNGLTPADPATLVSNTGYNTEPPTNVYINQQNYIYVRGLNNTSAALTDRIWLYYVPSSVVLWPNMWKGDKDSSIQVNAQVQNYTVISSAPAGQVVVTNPPFVWTAPTLPSGADHYCLVAFSDNTPITSPPVSPLQNLGTFGTWNDLANFVISNPNMAWRNTTPVNGTAPQWQFNDAVPGAQGGGQFSVGFQCKNMPTDGSITVNITGPDAADSVSFSSKITTPNMGLMWSVTWPPGFNSSIQYNWTSGGTNPPSGAGIQSVAAYPMSAVAAEMPWLLARQNGDWVYPGMNNAVKLFTYDSPAMRFGTIKIMHLVGSLQHVVTPGGN